MLKSPLGTSPDARGLQFRSERDWAALPPSARDVLGQLFLHGPLWDGYVSSKSGRDTLVSGELVERGHGWQWLTRRGVQVALCANAGFWFEGRWGKKQNGS